MKKINSFSQMSNHKVVFDKKVLDCFSVLGIEPTTNMCIIHRAYRDTVRMVHPDKVRHYGLHWTKDECQTAFNNIRESYTYLKSQFHEIDLPDYDVIYIDEEFNDEIKNSTVSTFNVEEFNKNFIKNHKVDDDYVTMGYSDFDRDTAKPYPSTLCVDPSTRSVDQPDATLCVALEELIKSRQEVLLPPNGKERSTKKNDKQIMRYLPDALYSSPTNYSVIGESVEDFTTGPTGSMVGLTDINNAYGDDCDTWEETYWKNFPKTQKGQSSLEDALKEMKLEVSTKVKPLDAKQLDQINIKKQIEETKERKRQKRAQNYSLKNY